MIFRDDATRMSKEYNVRHKSDTPEALDQYLVDTRDIGPPVSSVLMARLS